MKKKLILIIVMPLIISCFSKKSNTINKIYIKDTNSFNILMNQFANNIENIWGINEILITGPKDYVKYTDQYKTRSHVNFNIGTITIETIATDNLIFRLKKAITNILLMNNNLESMNFHSDTNDISISNKPFLYGQVLDNNGKPIRWYWCATRFADYLLQTSLQTRITNLRKVWFITIQLVPNHMDKRAHKYLNIVRKASQQYGIDQSLILAIIQAESSFNPYAVSSNNALGLMQIVRNSAGRDVFKMKGKWGQPSRSYLLDPQNNIDIGTAYLAILQNNYLSGIINPVSKRYAVITAYNSGAGSVLRVFSQNQNQAFKIINKIQPDEVYKTLYTKHPILESRHYLYKVNIIHKNINFKE